jgi:hypothetical protein
MDTQLAGMDHTHSSSSSSNSRRRSYAGPPGRRAAGRKDQRATRATIPRAAFDTTTREQLHVHAMTLTHM